MMPLGYSLSTISIKYIGSGNIGPEVSKCQRLGIETIQFQALSSAILILKIELSDSEWLAHSRILLATPMLTIDTQICSDVL